MKNLKNLACVFSLVLLGLTARGATIFDNTSLYNNNLYQFVSGQQIGNEVTLRSTLSGNFFLTNFMFEYYTTDNLTLNPSLGVDVRFYLNNGPLAGGYPTPGTLFYDSGWFFNTLGTTIPTGSNDISYASVDLYTGTGLTGFSALNSGLLGNVMPTEFTYVITFTNLGANSIYIPLANNSIGNMTNYGTYWRRDVGGNWGLLTNAAPANFISRFEGTVIPEPTTFGLAAIGGALLFGINKLRRKR